MKQLYAIQIREILATIQKEGWAFKLICFYLFLEYVRPQTIYPVLDAIPWSFITLALTAVVLLLSGGLKAQPNILNKLMVCYAVLVVFSITVTSQYPSISLSRWRVFFNWFFIYFLIVLIVNNEKRFFIFLLSFLLYSFKMSQHGFLSWAKRGFAFASWGVTGAPGFFQNSGEVGIQMCIYVPLAIAFILATYKLLSKPKLLFLLIMPFTGIATAVASSSRGALVGLAVAGIRPLLIRPRIFFISSIFLSIVTALTIISIPSKSMQRFRRMGTDTTSHQRLERWHDGLEAMHKYPVFGVGFEAWAEYLPQHYQLEYKGTKLIHNVFLQCGTELGLTGLSVFILMIIACFVNTRKVRKLSIGQDDQFLAIMSYGFDAALLGYLGSGFFITVMYYPYFWIHCALTTCLHTATQKKFASPASTLSIAPDAPVTQWNSTPK